MSKKNSPSPPPPSDRTKTGPPYVDGRSPHDDGRSPMARAMGLATQVTNIGLMMALPGLGGYWLDGRMGTGPLWLILGVFLGVGTGVYSLVKLTKQLEAANKKKKQESDITK